ncbi:MAG: PIG-L family deacetylase [Balneolaceae bacterium]
MKGYKILSFLIINVLIIFIVGNLFAQSKEDNKLRIIAFGAHPDDCEISAGGVGALWAEQGHAFLCVSMTNGDIGHFGMSGGELALRRMKEVEAAAEILGISTKVFDIHDGELVATLENRKKVAREIRNWQADIVMVHRRYTYHADHRYSGILVDDAIVLVEAKFFTPDTPPLPRSPVVLYYSDNFQRPLPFEPDIVVGIDDVIDKKRAAMEQMPSQFSDVDSWTYGRSEDVPEDEATRLRLRINNLMDRSVNIADRYRADLVELYGEDVGKGFKYAEAFQVSEFGRSIDVDELQKLFPILE